MDRWYSAFTSPMLVDDSRVYSRHSMGTLKSTRGGNERLMEKGSLNFPWQGFLFYHEKRDVHGHLYAGSAYGYEIPP